MAKIIPFSRRSVLTGLVSLLSAPAIVRAPSLMPVRVIIDRPDNDPYATLFIASESTRKPVLGDLWYDMSSSRLWIYDGRVWIDPQSRTPF